MASIVTGLIIKLTPHAMHASASARMMATLPMWAPTSDDEHAVSIATARSRPASHSWAHDFPPRHTTTRAAPAATGGLPGPGRMQCGTALQPALGLKTGIKARGCVAHIPCNRNNTIRRGYKQVSQGCRPGQGTRNVSGSPGVDDDDDTALKRLRFGIGMYWKRREGDPFGTFRVLGGHFVRIN